MSFILNPFKNIWGEPAPEKIVCPATPGLTTLLDTALFRTYEGQLTATISSANATLHAFLEIKSQAKYLLDACCIAIPSSSKALSSNTLNSKQQKQKQLEYAKLNTLESFARFCIECSNEAIVQIMTDKLSSSANLPETNSNSDASTIGLHMQDTDVLQGVRSSQDNAWAEVASRLSSAQQHRLREKDCWESTKLFCCDYVWADEAQSQCKRLVRGMMKHDAVEQMMMVIDYENEHVLPPCDGDTKDEMLYRYEMVTRLLRNDLPLRLRQFRHGIESDTVVSKRLYLVKNEYRAPFRSFLEAHIHVQKAPSRSLVMEYINLHKNKKTKELKERRTQANQTIQECIKSEILTKVLTMEEKCETLEVHMAKMLLPFCEVSRLLMDGRTVVPIVEVPDMLEPEDVLRMQELVKRLKRLLCKKLDRDCSTGIRPLLLDLQNVPRDASSVGGIDPFHSNTVSDTSNIESIIKSRLEKMCSLLTSLYEIGKGNKFGIEKKEIESLSSGIRACSNFNGLDFTSTYMEWYDMSKEQNSILLGSTQQSISKLSDTIREAEIEVSIAMASSQALSIVLQRIDMLERDRQKKFEILQDMVQECCLREMDLVLDLRMPDISTILHLPDIKSVSGLFEKALEIAGDELSLY